VKSGLRVGTRAAWIMSSRTLGNESGSGPGLGTRCVLVTQDVNTTVSPMVFRSDYAPMLGWISAPSTLRVVPQDNRQNVPAIWTHSERTPPSSVSPGSAAKTASLLADIGSFSQVLGIRDRLS
jgi:hypothetical protein